MKPKLIVFDLDDTLMAFGVVVEEAWDEAADTFIKKHDISKDVLLEKISNMRKKYWNDPEKHKIGKRNMIDVQEKLSNRH